MELDDNILILKMCHTCIDNQKDFSESEIEKILKLERETWDKLMKELGCTDGDIIFENNNVTINSNGTTIEFDLSYFDSLEEINEEGD